MTTKTSFRYLIAFFIAAMFITSIILEIIAPQGVFAKERLSAVESEAMLPAAQSPTLTPAPTNRPTLTPPTVTIEGHIYYEALSQDSGTSISVTNPLSRVRIQVWDDSGSILGQTWAEDTCTTCDAGHYSITVPNNESGGIDPFLKIFVEDIGHPSGSRVQVVDFGGSVYNASTGFVQYNLQNGQTYLYDYTFQPAYTSSDLLQAMYIFDRIANTAYNFLHNQVQWNQTTSVQVKYPSGCLGDTNNDSCYYDGIIYMHPNWEEHPDVFIHEYGHFVQSRYLHPLTVALACLEINGWPPKIEHSIWVESDSDCAYIEGWADFFQAAVQNSDNFNDIKLEDVEADLRGITGSPENYEGIVAASLLDFFDTVHEPWDALDDGFNGPSDKGVWYFSLSIPHPFLKPSSIKQFWNNWYSGRPTNACYGSAILQHHLLMYDPQMYPLSTSVNPTAGGSVGVGSAPNCPGSTYANGTSVMLTGNPLPGYAFMQWGGSSNSTSNPLTILMDAAKTYTAHFATITPTPTATPTHTATPTATRTLTPTPTITPTRTNTVVVK